MCSSDLNFQFLYNGTFKASISRYDGSYFAGSDERLKHEIQQLDPVLDRVLKLNPRTYLMNDTPEQTIKSVGFIAQEVESLFPETVNNDGEYKALAYDHFSVYAIAAIQEQQELITQLQEENKELKLQMEKQYAQILKQLEGLEKTNSETKQMDY